MPFVVVLDACVLVPAALHDLLLRSVSASLYRMHWTNDILDEVRRNLISDIHVPEEKAQSLIDVMRKQFPGAMITHHTALIDVMANDHKDRHVLAAAVACKAQVIVTQNLRHFMPEHLEPLEIEAQSPDEFLTNLFSLYPEQIKKIVKEQAQDLRKPPVSVSEVVNILALQAPKFAELLRTKNEPLKSQ